MSSSSTAMVIGSGSEALGSAMRQRENRLVPDGPLKGMTIGVTAERRAAEQTQLLQKLAETAPGTPCQWAAWTRSLRPHVANQPGLAPGNHRFLTGQHRIGRAGSSSLRENR